MTDQVAAPRLSVPTLPPSTRGWTSAAIAVHSMREIATPMLMQLDVADLGSIVIDFRHNAFAWDTEVSIFPVDPASVSIFTQAVQLHSPAAFPLPGYNLDPLLWSMGLHSFHGAPASWLKPGARYRLRRWPNLTGLRHSVDQMRMISLIANTFLTAEELADATNTDTRDAQRLINALSLMGILRVSTESAAPVLRTHPAAAHPDAAPTLFQRLRKRLGL